MTTKKTKLSCPECGKKFNTAKGMASHRRTAHGVAGTGKSTIAARKLKEMQMKLLPAVPLVAAKDFRCPDCGEIFANNKDLGLHRRGQHGVKGKAPSSITAQRRREEYLANYKRDDAGLLICPECTLSYSERGMTVHRLQVHHISTAEQMAMFEKNKIMAKIETVAEIPAGEKCPECDFVAKDERGLRRHISAQHALSNTKAAVYKREKRNQHLAQPTQAITIAQTNGHVTHSAEEAHAAPSGYTIPEGTLALALGRFQGLCQSISTEFDLPPRMFATRLAELIYHTQIR